MQAILVGPRARIVQLVVPLTLGARPAREPVVTENVRTERGVVLELASLGVRQVLVGAPNLFDVNDKT